MSDVQHFEGTCDVCDATITHDYSPSEGVIDTWHDTETGEWGTWIRHIENRDVNPDCDIYSSRVRFVPARGTEENTG